MSFDHTDGRLVNNVISFHQGAFLSFTIGFCLWLYNYVLFNSYMSTKLKRFMSVAPVIYTHFVLHHACAISNTVNICFYANIYGIINNQLIRMNKGGRGRGLYNRLPTPIVPIRNVAVRVLYSLRDCIPTVTPWSGLYYCSILVVKGFTFVR